MKRKVVCPNKDIHDVCDKILFAFEGNKLWIPCGGFNRKKKAKCGWVEVTINDNNGVTLKQMPKKYHLDLVRIPTLEIGERNV